MYKNVDDKDRKNEKTLKTNLRIGNLKKKRGGEKLQETYL